MSPADKKNIDRLLAFLLTMPEVAVSRVTTAFLHQTMQHIIAEGGVHLRGFGRFTLKKSLYNQKRTPLSTKNLRDKKKGKRTVFIVRHKHRIHFSQSPTFRNLLKDAFGPGGALMNEDSEGMTKYGVDEDIAEVEEAEKVASSGCTSCGGKLEKHGSVLLCENCGSKPFERGI